MRALLLAISLCAACGGTMPSGSKGGCDTRTQNGVCLDFNEAPNDVIAPYKANCAPSGGTWIDAGCPKQGRVGGCRVTEASLSLVSTQWAYPPTWTRDSVIQTCSGMFVEP
jgi:hypothetical protein